MSRTKNETKPMPGVKDSSSRPPDSGQTKYPDRARHTVAKEFRGGGKMEAQMSGKKHDHSVAARKGGDANQGMGNDLVELHRRLGMK